MNPAIKPDLAKVKDCPGLIRDTHSGALLAHDLEEKRKFIEKRNASLRTVAENQQLREEVNSVKKELAEIKDLLKLVINNVANGQNLKF